MFHWSLRSMICLTIIVMTLSQVSLANACGMLFGRDLILASKPFRSTNDAGHPFVEFRARTNGAFGHSYAVVGLRHNGRDRVVRIAGLYPDRRNADPALSTFVGKARVGYTARDRQTVPAARFRKRLSSHQFNRLNRRIASASGNPGTYSITQRNCNAFVGELASAIGLRRPANPLMPSIVYIQQLASLNARNGDLSPLSGVLAVYRSQENPVHAALLAR